MSRVDALYQPFQLKGLHLPNRIVMAPMSRGFSPDGIPTAEVARYYARRAGAEVGLILSEGTGVARPASLHGPSFPLFHGKQALVGWKGVIDAVHAAGGLMAPQLWHVGAMTHGDPPVMYPFESPSGLTAPNRPLGNTMSDEDIADTIAAFARAAFDAQQLGFDAVELHGAHGYLIDQFFWEGTNLRADHYGGPTMAERGRFAAEIIQAVRARVGDDYPILIRLSQWKLNDYGAQLAKTPSEMEQWLRPLVDAGADMLDCSQRRFWEPEFPGSDLNFAGWAKKLSGLPTITVGSIGLSGEIMAAFAGESSKPTPLQELLRRFDRGDFDLVAIGRALLQDPQWAVKVHHGRDHELMNFEAAAMGTLS